MRHYYHRSQVWCLPIIQIVLLLALFGVSLPLGAQKLDNSPNSLITLTKKGGNDSEWSLLISSTPSHSLLDNASVSEPSLAGINRNNASLVVRINKEFLLPEAHKKLLSVGTPLPFNLTFTLKQPRWYAWSKEWAEVVLPINLGFDPISHQYWVYRLQQTEVFNAIEDLEKKSLHMDWWVMPILNLPKGEYQATLKLSLDQKALPLPLKMDARAIWQWELPFPSQTIKID